MSDPLSMLGAVTGAAKALDPNSETAKLTTSLWGDVLGPPAKALGTHFEKQVTRWSESKEAKRVLVLAAAKANMSVDGIVSPRVAAAVLNAAQYSDDEFVAEYLSGVLASSRTPGGKDDRGVTWSALVARLPSDALKLHYVIYSILRRHMRGAEVKVLQEWCSKHIVIPYIELLPALGFTAEEAIARTVDAAYILQREGLLGTLTHGSAHHLTGYPYGGYVLPFRGDMFILTTTIHGIQLFLQGHGYGGVWASAIADTDKQFAPAGEVDQRLSEVHGAWLHELPPRGI